ncbi:hypothetical protein [Rhodococcus sp. ACPA1]|nr:hypothetical protein [Rhodococcus sp. ACPA1]
MREYFDDALVTGWEPLEGTFSLPDPDESTSLRPPSSAVPG